MSEKELAIRKLNKE